MDSVRLVEFRVHRNSLKKERIKRHFINAGQSGKDLVKGVLVLLAPIGRRNHAEEQYLGAGGLDFLDHSVEIIAYSFGVDAAQRVIGAERQDNQVRFLGERPINPREPPGRGIPRNAGIYNPRLDPPAAKPRLEPGREGLFRRQSISGSQAVAKINNNGSVRPSRYGGDGQGQRSSQQKIN